MAKKILVVADKRHVVRLARLILPRHGYEVHTAYDGRQALEKVKEVRPDLIVLDVNMPRLDGFGVLKRLKADPETRDIPVIMLTAKAQDADFLSGWP
jgi:CheY-like chemotaxis protein